MTEYVMKMPASYVDVSKEEMMYDGAGWNSAGTYYTVDFNSPLRLWLNMLTAGNLTNFEFLGNEINNLLKGNWNGARDVVLNWAGVAGTACSVLLTKRPISKKTFKGILALTGLSIPGAKDGIMYLYF